MLTEAQGATALARRVGVTVSRSIARRSQVIAPPLRHLDALRPVRAPAIGGAHLIGVGMGQRPLNRVETPSAALVQQRRGGRPEAARGHDVGAEPSRRNAPLIAFSHIGFNGEPSFGKTYRQPPLKAWASRRIANACFDSGTRCGWRCFMRLPGSSKRPCQSQFHSSGLPNLAGPLEDMRCEAERNARRGLASVVLDCAKQAAECDRVSNRRVMLGHW